MLTLILATAHLVSGLTILMVASWFIAACSLAGAGFNYMLPAVVIRALALIRIASGYGYMFVGHSDLLERIASIRLGIFAGLKNKVVLARGESLDALHHQSEEVASIWIAWVSQNAGVLLSILLLNVVLISVAPMLTFAVIGFSAVFFTVYGMLMVSLVLMSADVTEQRRKSQLSIIQHIESVSVWHLYRDFEQQAPLMMPLRKLENRIEQRIRIATTVLFLAAMVTTLSIFSMYSIALSGNVVFVILPMALLSINDWLSPTLSNQKQLLRYWQAKHAIASMAASDTPLSEFTRNINALCVKGFKPDNTRMREINAHFKEQSISVLIGSSGAGKSRFLQSLQGLIPFNGKKWVSSKSTPNMQSCVENNTLITDCLYVEQFPHILSDTLRANLLIANVHSTDEHLFSALRRVGLGQLSNLDVWLGENGLQLSGGEKKRIGLARAILSESSVLLLDEPFEALDSGNTQLAANVINELAHKRMVILATHIVPEELAYHQLLSLDDHSVSFCQHELLIRNTRND